MAKIENTLPPITTNTGGGTSIHNDLSGLNVGNYIHLTAIEKTKFDNLPNTFAPIDAEKNVNTDWNATSGDEQLLNKPSTFTPSAHTHLETDITDLDKYTQSETDTLLNNKVDKVAGSSLVTDAEKIAITHLNRNILDNITESFTTALKTAYDGTVSWITTNGTNILNHLSSTSNPHNVTKSQVGLSNVPNTDTTTTVNIIDSTNKRFVTDAEKTKLSNTSGTNTGDETTSSIQTKRPLKTIEGQSLEGSGNIDLTKSDVGLSNVDNTSDANKPVSTAQATAIGLKEDSSNKSTSTSDSTSTTKFPVWSAILSYFDASRIRTLLGITTLSGINTGDNAINTTSNTYADAKVEDAIVNGVTDKAPSQNAVFYALALKQNILNPLAFSDFWQEHQFNTLTPPMMGGTAISSGTNSTAIPSADVSPRYPYGAFLRSSTTANGGYRYQVVNTGYDFFGTVSHKFQCVFYWMTSFTGRTIRLGYLDTSTSADSSDGAYFEILDNAINCKTASSAVRTTTPMTATLSLAINYAFDIEVNSSGTLVTFRLYNADTSALIETQTISTNIPTTSARTFGASFIATEVSVTASDIGILRYIGFGTIDGFNRRR